ncbi:hypothetical protein HDZ31DRAFT_72584 [Schizophyllum fasciatum]
MQLSLFRLLLAVLALLVVAVAAETNAERMSQGLPPLPPRWLVKYRTQTTTEDSPHTEAAPQPESRPEARSRTETAEPRTVSMSPNVCMINWSLFGEKWCCRRRWSDRLSNSYCYPADSWGRCYEHDYPHKRCCNMLFNVCQ